MHFPRISFSPYLHNFLLPVMPSKSQELAVIKHSKHFLPWLKLEICYQPQNRKCLSLNWLLACLLALVEVKVEKMTLLKEFLNLSDIPNIQSTVQIWSWGNWSSLQGREVSPSIPTEKEQKHKFHDDISLMFKCICRNSLLFSLTLRWYITHVEYIKANVLSLLKSYCGYDSISLES